MANNAGMIQLNFFVEHDPLPVHVIHPINEQGVPSPAGTISSAQDDPENFVVVREYQTAVVFSPATARRLQALLGNFIKISAQITGEGSDDDE
jgi:hypothetical protein